MSRPRFNRDLAKKLYRTVYRDIPIDDKKLELLLIRGELLVRNPRFIEDWTHLSNTEGENRKTILEKWGLDQNGLYDLKREKDPIVRAYGGQPNTEAEQFGYLTCIIDLRYSKRKILSQLSVQIDKWKSMHEEDRKEEILDSLADLYGGYHELELHPEETESQYTRIKSLDRPDRLTGNIASDLQDYENYIKIWDLKRENSWRNVTQALGVSMDTVRNWHHKANDLIENGLPGFLPFS